MGLLQMVNDAGKTNPQASVSHYYGDDFYKAQWTGL